MAFRRIAVASLMALMLRVDRERKP